MMLKQASQECLQQLFAVQAKCEESKAQCRDMQDRVSKQVDLEDEILKKVDDQYNILKNIIDEQKEDAKKIISNLESV